MTALATVPTGLRDVLRNVCIRRVHCNNNHITTPPRANANPATP